MKRREFFSLNGRDKICLALIHIFYAKLECLLSVSRWSKESTIHHVWQYMKSSLDRARALLEISGLLQLALDYSRLSTIWVPISCILLCNPQQEEHVWPHGKLWYCVCLPTILQFHKLWTFGHVWELWQSKHTQSTTSSIIVDVFPLLKESVCRCTYIAFMPHVYTVCILQPLVYGQCRTILCHEKTYHSVYFTFAKYTEDAPCLPCNRTRSTQPVLTKLYSGITPGSTCYQYQGASVTTADFWKVQR